jgi:hypothetical protein
MKINSTLLQYYVNSQDKNHKILKTGGEQACLMPETFAEYSFAGNPARRIVAGTAA